MLKELRLTGRCPPDGAPHHRGGSPAALRLSFTPLLQPARGSRGALQVRGSAVNERELIEAAARAICAVRWSGREDAWPTYQGQARAVVAALRKALKHEVVERCASLCDRLGEELQVGPPFASGAEVVTSVNEAVGAQKCAQAIRALSPLSRSREG